MSDDVKAPDEAPVPDPTDSPRADEEKEHVVVGNGDHSPTEPSLESDPSFEPVQHDEEDAIVDDSIESEPSEEPITASNEDSAEEPIEDHVSEPVSSSAEPEDEPSFDDSDETEEASDSIVEEIVEEEAASTNGESNKHWYVVKVQSGREDTIKEAIERRVKKEGLEEFFGQIVIPVEKYTEIKTDKNGKRVTRTKERKLYPGYLMVEVEYNDRILYLFRETSGVGDFVGAHPGDLTRAPSPMTPREVERMIGKVAKPGDKEEPVSPKPKWLQESDRVRVVDGTFNGMDGIVKKIKEHESKVEVELTIFGRPVSVDLEYYQVEQL